ncbi:MAG TPA: DUF6081 family protein [Dehalococcoidia bacterium]|nr:DUF6081 family protein [Dehalococcoidia bacterium]
MTTSEQAEAKRDHPHAGGTSREYGGFADLLKPSSPWQFGGFPLPDGGFWQYREPNSTVLVRNGRLQCTVHPFTRTHDRIQFLDNAKQMWFSKERFAVPEHGAISFELSIAARGFGTAPGDLYDGFVSFNLLDFSSGWALDFFVSNDVIATVYGRLPFPGVTVPDTGPVRNFCLFKELDLPTRPGQRHDFRIVYDRAADTVEWFIDGELVNREEAVPDKIDGFTAALGLMTEKDLGPNGSTSLHGQGLSGEWSPLRITLLEPRPA